MLTAIARPYLGFAKAPLSVAHLPISSAWSKGKDSCSRSPFATSTRPSRGPNRDSASRLNRTDTSRSLARPASGSPPQAAAACGPPCRQRGTPGRLSLSGRHSPKRPSATIPRCPAARASPPTGVPPRRPEPSPPGPPGACLDLQAALGTPRRHPPRGQGGADREAARRDVTARWAEPQVEPPISAPIVRTAVQVGAVEARGGDFGLSAPISAEDACLGDGANGRHGRLRGFRRAAADRRTRRAGTHSRSSSAVISGASSQ